MPYEIRKVRNKECYAVKNKQTGVVHSKCSTKENAKKQMKLLYLLDAQRKKK